MSWLQAFILGMIQGVAEFLPISSSGHLKLGQLFFGFGHLEHYVLFDLVCHLGTLGVIFWVFREDIWLCLTENRLRVVWILVGILPLFFLVPFLSEVKLWINQPKLLGWMFLCTSLLLFLGDRLGKEKHRDILKQPKWGHALTIGLAQLCAIAPGISRSGSTISTARILGWNIHEAKVFSFLLAIPAILGGTLLEAKEVFLERAVTADVSFFAYTLAFLASFLSGYWALHHLIRVLERGCLRNYQIYTAGLGLLTLIYVNFNLVN